jgi:hypothetical protein
MMWKSKKRDLITDFYIYSEEIQRFYTIQDLETKNIRKN